ncbi:MAG TPA: LodA/GoxA family CTQ-dependent oxidase [Kofleriaceae bacterium]|nr:LodA/GoxA family CTQ-dependent oxidase [Kofleriaceae bacterium]
MSESSEAVITQFAIYPAIGIARVGNSPTGVFFGPEQPGEVRRGPYRDDAGRIKRQAARFRVYGLDAHGRVVKEITAADARITWRVEVANTKAAWFDFDLALDIPEALGTNTASGVASLIRNPDVKGAERAALAITPPAVRIAGRHVNEHGGERAYELTGHFVGKPVYLGEARTDDAGRLVFLGGRGVSASADGKPLTTFANNAGWHDDVSDGPIDATIEYEGKTFEATGAWVVVGRPTTRPACRASSPATTSCSTSRRRPTRRSWPASRASPRTSTPCSAGSRSTSGSTPASRATSGSARRPTSTTRR